MRRMMARHQGALPLHAETSTGVALVLRVFESIQKIDMGVFMETARRLYTSGAGRLDSGHVP